MQILSYDVMGTKELFAGWISNISPLDTPFVSLTGKAPVYDKLFEWQYDRLEHAGINAHDSSTIPEPILKPTIPVSNITQILRKVVQVSHTTDALSLHGKSTESEYQIEKASKEIKRDLEKTFLSRQERDDTSNVRKTACFHALVAPLNEADTETGAVTHKQVTGGLSEEAIWDIDKELYLAGSRANTLMFHPTHINTFNDMSERVTGSRAATRVDKWDGAKDHDINNLVTAIISPLGREYYLIPNVHCDPDLIYFFHPHDWFQRILRAPDINPLASQGSYEKWMIEMEVGLQHRNPWASGIIELNP